MEMPFRFKNNVLIVEIAGKSTGNISGDTDDFIEEIISLHNKESSRVAFDLSQKGFLNSSGLGELVRVKDALSDVGVSVVLIKPGERIMSLLDVMGLNDFFEIVDSDKDIR